MKTTELWPIFLETLISIGKQIGPDMEESAKSIGMPRFMVSILLTAWTLEDDEELTERTLQKRIPYQSYKGRLLNGVELGFLGEVKPGIFESSEKGKNATQKIIDAAYLKMEHLDPMRSPDLHFLTQLVRDIVIACLTHPEPADKWSLRHSRGLDPGEHAAILIKLDQYLSDLAAFRDDVHIAAWKPLGVDGPTWETLAMFARDDADSADTLLERLQHREYPDEVFQEAIKQLIEKGWLAVSGKKLNATEEGKETYIQVEAETNRLFYAPWDFLSEMDVETLVNLMSKLQEGLT